jgi:hypothetical protein
MWSNRISSDWRHDRQSKLVVKVCRRGCLTIALLAVIVCASTANGKYGGGNGNSTNPYLIYTAKDIFSIGLDINDWDKCFILMSDIDMNDYNAPSAFPIIGYLKWDPYDSKPFKGSFDGNNKKISNLNIRKIGADYTGLFGYVNGQQTIIKDLTLVNPNINGLLSIHTGAIAGRLKNGIVTGCSVQNGLIRGNSYVGGLIGYNINGTITNCTVEATIYGTTDVGGLIGYNFANDVLDCGFSGTVNGQGDIGGLVGENDGQITSCYAMATVVGSKDKVGGLIGTSRGLVNQCFAIGSVTGKIYVGGLIGRSAGQISDSYAQGTIAGSNDVGGFTGLLYNQGTIMRCYAVCSLNANAIQTCNLVGVLDDSATVTASFSPDTTSTSAMMMENTYATTGWKFVGETANGTDNPWTICEGMNYPRLSWKKLYQGDWICPDGVDIFDIALLCENWLTMEASADIYLPRSVGIVNFPDWAVFSRAWKTKRGMPGWNNKCDLWPEGGDGVIDEMDLSVFMARWLTNGAGPYDIAPAVRGDQTVNFLDFAVAAKSYLKRSW